MKKRLLFATLALVCASASFAYNDGDYAFTKNGRVKVTGENLITNGSFDEGTSGWTDAEGNDVSSETWTVEPGVGENGENAIMSQGANEGAALARVLPLAPGTYVVSYQIRATGETLSGTTSIGTTVGSNYADIFVNTTASIAKEETSDDAPVINVAIAESFTDAWKTVNYYFTVEEGQTLVIHFEKMATGIQLTNFSVNTADEVYDIRIAQKKIAFAKLLLDDPNFNTAAAADARAELMDEVIPAIEAMIESGEFDDFTTAESLMGEEGFEGKVAAYLDASSYNIAKNDYFNYVEDLTAFPKYNRGGISEGQVIGGFRFHGENWLHAQDADQLNKQIQGTYTTNGGDGKVGLYNNKMPAGKYYVAAEVRNGYCDKNYNYIWNLEGTVRAFVGSNEQEAQVIIGEDFVKFYFIADFDGATDFEAGFIWGGCDTGSTFQIKGFEIRSFDDVAPHVERMVAWEKFIAQYNAMVGARNKLLTLIGNKDYPWSQSTLTEAQETWDPYYNEFMAKGWVDGDGNDTGVATTEELDDWATTTGVYGMEAPYDKYALVRGYQYANDAVIAANKPIKDLLAAINNAKSVRNNPKNVNGDKSLIEPAIEEASNAYKDIYANTNDERREADEATIEAQIKALADAIEAFEGSAAVVPFIDIDFSDGVSEDATGASVAIGNPGQMVISPYEADNTTNSFSLGTGDALMDVLRVGKGTATVDFDPADDDEILEVSFDLWVGNLTKRNVYIDLQNGSGERVAGFSLNRYNASVDYNDFNDGNNTGLDLLTYVSGLGKSGVADGSLCVDENKSSFTLVINYKTGTVKGKVVNGKNGTCDGAEIAINGELTDNKIMKFVLGSNYDNAGRRCWFDNLKIFKYSAGDDGVEGDVNGDGDVDVADISAILTEMANPGTYGKAADVNSDEYVDVADISRVLTIMAGK